MKKLLLLFLFVTSISFGQQAYYNDVDLTANGLQLRDNLATKIINTHTHYLSYADVWEALKITDLDPADPTNSKVLLIYGYSDTDGNYVTDRTRSKTANGGNAGTDWNREHTYAKSLGNPNLGTSGPGSDAHHLRAADVSFNSQRSSKKFASGTGNAGDSNGGWYPGDEWKGDIARMMMYMYLRYGNQCLPSGVAIGSANAVDANMIDLLLQWNAEDPVSQEEDNRNAYLSDANNTYGQGNRNPFIDNPYLATRIWGGPTAEDRWNTVADTQAPTVPTNVTASNITSTTGDLNWTASTDNVAVTSYDIYKDGAYFATSTSNAYTATGLTQNTTYNFTVYAKDAAGNTSTVSNAATLTTLSSLGGGGSSTELFISEYVEGSSYNKAIEIANFTGSSVDLSQYTIKKQSNGAGAWSSGLVLSGQLTSGSVFVAANSSAVTAITSLANILSSGTELSFNGNDAVGLFKNGVLIDIIGTFNGGTANFAKDVTLRRKNTKLSPNITYTVNEWDSYAMDTFDGLGNHSITGGTQDTQAPTVPTNLTASNITSTTADLSWTASTDNVAVTSYDIYKDGVYLASSSTNSYNLTSLTVGTSYSFTVIAKDAAGNISTTSIPLTVTTIDTQAPTVPTNLTASNITSTTADLTWTASTDNVAVTSYDIYKDNVYLASSATNTYTVTGLTQNTAYNFNVYAKDVVGNTSTVSNTATLSTLSSSGGGGSSTELFISEYVEGSSNNKAIEIANFTGSSVDLSTYTLKRNVNGGSTWGTALPLSGTLVNNGVFVIANSSSSASILSVANLTSSADAMLFNGNDPVGLFKNGVLIDIVGPFNGGTANFAKDVTLRRKSTINSPNTTYTVNEWDSYVMDTFDGLGNHSITGGTQNTNVLFSNSFETGWDGWIDGGTDCYRINSAKSFDGNYSIRIRDNSGTQSAMTSSSYDVSTYDNLEIKFNFYSYSMEANEDFWLQYFDGTSWKTVKAFVSGVDFTNDTFTAETINISSTTYNFPVDAQFRFQCDASSNSDEIYIDNVIVTASSGVVVAAKNNIKTVTKKQILSVSNNLPEIEDMGIYPNPAVNNSVLKAEIDIEDAIVNVQVKIMNLQGRLVKVLNFKNVKSEFFEKNLQLTNIESGVYFVNISTNNGLSITKRLIVK